jgi:hypothetical protein
VTAVVAKSYAAASIHGHHFPCCLALYLVISVRDQECTMAHIAKTRKEYFQETSEVHVKPGPSDLCDTKEVHDTRLSAEAYSAAPSPRPWGERSSWGGQCVAVSGHHPRMACMHRDCYILESLACGNDLLPVRTPSSSTEVSNRRRQVWASPKWRGGKGSGE